MQWYSGIASYYLFHKQSDYLSLCENCSTLL